MAATYVIFLDHNNVFKVGKTATETPGALESESDLATVEATKVARCLRRLLQAGQSTALHELADGS